MSKRLSLLLALGIAWQPVVAVAPRPVSVYQSIIPELLPMEPDSMDEDENIFPANGEAEHLTDGQRRHIVFSLFGRYSKSNILKPAYQQFDTNLIRKDLEIFTQTEGNLFRKICRTKTVFGEAVFAKMLAMPTPDRAELQRRQSIVQALIDSPELFALAEQCLDKIKSVEALFLSFFSPKNELRQQLLADLYFNKMLWGHFDVNTAPWDRSPKFLLGAELANKSLMVLSLLFLKWRWEMAQREAGTPFLVGYMGLFTLLMLKPKWFHKIAPAGVTIGGLVGLPYGLYKGYKEWKKGGSLDASRVEYEIDRLAPYAANQREQQELLNVKPQIRNLTERAEAANQQRFEGLSFPGKCWAFANTTLKMLYDKVTMAELIVNTPLQIVSSWGEVKGWYVKYRHLHAKFRRLEQAIGLLHNVNEAFVQQPTLVKNMAEIVPMIRSLELEEGISKEMKNLLTLLKEPTFKGPFTVASHIGRITAANSLMLVSRRDWVEIFESIGALDAYVSLARLMKQSGNRAHAPWCFATYEERKTPHLALTDFWNPFVDPEKVVTNSLELGKSERHMILTGPNTGGKSTVLKAIAINVLLAQTFGVAAARSCTLAPFSAVITNIRIEDNIEKGISLFMAETKRAKLLKDTVATLPQDQFGLVIIDEMFRGTAPDQAALLAHYYAKDELGTLPNCMLLEATHYPDMIKLEAETNGLFANYRVAIERNPDGTLKRTYQLQRGSTTQNVAADILREQGFAIKPGG